VLYAAVRDPHYPRIRRLRRFLEDRGIEVVVAAAVFDRSTAENVLHTVANLARLRGPFDAIVLAEFSQKYAVPAWLTARRHRARFLVDGFVGLYETVVDDRRAVPNRSLRAWSYRAFDRVALRLADVYLTDTEVRAAAARRLNPATEVVSLPVGAPEWAQPISPSIVRVRNDEPLRVRYYGNFIPLHGVEYAVRAVLALARARPVVLTLVGDLDGHPSLAREIAASGQRAAVVLTGRVPEAALGDLIRNHDVTLGIFGTSPKAATVIANKVWQPLACGKPVLTRRSPALDELAEIVGDQLVTVEPGSAAAIECTLANTDWRSLSADPDVAARIEAYVSQCYARLSGHLSDAATK
jgi:glycosyltransferase involved in cell wall biosynthesis